MSDILFEKDSHLSVVTQNPANIAESPSIRKRGRPFQKGNVMNPGGRPKLTDEEKAEKFDLVVACRAAAPSALKTLLHLAEHGKQESVRMNASAHILERAYGKAVQPTDNIHRDGRDIETMTPEDAYKVLIGERKVA